MPLTIDSLAEQINEAASKYRVGGLQELRAKLHGKDLRNRKLFTKQTIFQEKKYAFHYGGRTELQFNIGMELRDGRVWWRHGVAFSFEKGRNLQFPTILLPKVHHFNKWVESHADKLLGFKMWHHERGGSHSEDRPPGAIPDAFASEDAFVFLGARVREAGVDGDQILRDFDRLYELYEYVESNAERENTASLQAEEQAAIAALERKHGKGQGFLQNTELRVAVEKYAMDAARRHFETNGFACEDQSKNHSYDFRCKRRQEVLYIEVKGTQTDGDEIILTANEVEFARKHKSQMGLFILRSIQVTEVDGKFCLTGGDKKLVLPWDVDHGCLEPLSFMYQIPVLSPSAS